MAFWSVCIQCCACKPSSSANQSKHSAFFFFFWWFDLLGCMCLCLYVCRFWSSLLQTISVVKVSNSTSSIWIVNLTYLIIFDPVCWPRPYAAGAVSFLLVTLSLCMYSMSIFKSLFSSLNAEKPGSYELIALYYKEIKYFLFWSCCSSASQQKLILGFSILFVESFISRVFVQTVDCMVLTVTFIATPWWGLVRQ